MHMIHCFTNTLYQIYAMIVGFSSSASTS